MDNEKSFWAEIGNSDEIFLATSADSVSDSLSTIGETVSGSTLSVDDGYVSYFGNTVNLTSSSYSSLNAIDASKVTSNVHLIGNSRSNTLIGGTAGNTLDGGTGGDNVLQASNSTRRDYFVHKGSGLDTARSFVGGMESTSDVAILQKSSVSAVYRDGNSIYILSGTDDGLVVQTNDAIIGYGNYVGGAVMAAKISSLSSVDYESDITYFCTTEDGTLNVNGSSSTNIWLGGEAGVYYGYIKDINATNSTGANLLVGNNEDNIIYAGSGSNTLWGGLGNDALVGGSGVDTFRYGLYEGNTYITNSDLFDTVDLYDVSLTDIVASNSEGTLLALTFRNGQSVLVEGTGTLSANFKLANGSQYYYDYSTKSWSAAQ